MKREHTWWVTFGEHIKLVLTLSYWNPLDTLELRRSLKIERLCSSAVPVVSIVIALLFVKMEWYLYIN